MKKISLNNGRTGEICGSVEFVDGLAAVECAVLVGRDVRKIICNGVINLNFEEAFSNENDIASQSLMFDRPGFHNHRIVQCDANNFVTEISWKEDGLRHSQYRHIRIINGVPTIIAIFSQHLNETNRKNVVLFGNQFYDVLEGQYLTHAFQEVSLVDPEKGIYYIQDKLALAEAEEVPYVDYWNFQMDTSLNLLSFVWSSRGEHILKEGLTFSEYLNYRSDRMDELGKEEQMYSKRILALKTPARK